MVPQIPRFVTVARKAIAPPHALARQTLLDREATSRYTHDDTLKRDKQFKLYRVRTGNDRCDGGLGP